MAEGGRTRRLKRSLVSPRILRVAPRMAYLEYFGAGVLRRGAARLGRQHFADSRGSRIASSQESTCLIRGTFCSDPLVARGLVLQLPRVLSTAPSSFTASQDGDDDYI
ncbi:hypothetical protein MTO96_010549 [Rhipicephalus appendiculatus]